MPPRPHTPPEFLEFVHSIHSFNMYQSLRSTMLDWNIVLHSSWEGYTSCFLPCDFWGSFTQKSEVYFSLDFGLDHIIFFE